MSIENDSYIESENYLEFYGLLEYDGEETIYAEVRLIELFDVWYVIYQKMYTEDEYAAVLVDNGRMEGDTYYNLDEIEVDLASGIESQIIYTIKNDVDGYISVVNFEFWQKIGIFEDYSEEDLRKSMSEDYYQSEYDLDADSVKGNITNIIYDTCDVIEVDGKPIVIVTYKFDIKNTDYYGEVWYAEYNDEKAVLMLGLSTHTEEEFLMANSNAKTIYNLVAEFTADRQLIGEPYVFFGEEFDPEDETFSELGEYVIELMNEENMGGIAYVGDRYDGGFFVQWRSAKNPSILGQYPHPVSTDEMDDVIWGIYYD